MYCSTGDTRTLQTRFCKEYSRRTGIQYTVLSDCAVFKCTGIALYLYRTVYRVVMHISTCNILISIPVLLHGDTGSKFLIGPYSTNTTTGKGYDSIYSKFTVHVLVL